MVYALNSSHSLPASVPYAICTTTMVKMFVVLMDTFSHGHTYVT